MEQDQVNREQEELDRTQDNLTFSEVLHLLSKKAVLGRGIPEKYDIPPWRLPHTQQHSNQINNLVQHSMMAQAAQIPNSGDFADFVLSNARYQSQLLQLLCFLGIIYSPSKAPPIINVGKGSYRSLTDFIHN